MKKALALVLAFIMLCSLVVVSVSASEEATDWKAVTKGLGLHIYVGAPMETSPVVDGTISEGEYSFSREIPREEIVNYTAEIQSGVTEYIAHDADYIYYAAVFEQYLNDRAFQWFFVPSNTFHVFKDKTDLRDTLHQRVTWQLAYQDNGTTTVRSAPAWNYSIEDALPVVGENGDLEYAATKTTEGDIKTYEIKLKKSYIANYADCEVADVNVVPYITYFHGGPSISHMYTEDDVAVLTEAGATRADKDTALYLFMVLEEDPATTTVATTTTEAPATTTVAEATTTAAATTTTAKAADATTTAAAEEKGGCGSTLAISALVMIPTLAGGVILTSKKRRED